MSTLLSIAKPAQDALSSSDKLGTPDFDSARRFLTLLAEGEDWTFQTFDDTGNHNNALARIFHSQGGEISDKLLKDLLAALNNQGAGIFVMVNRGDGQGRRTENVTGVRAVFVDLDQVPLSVLDSAPLPPHLVVESSPRRYHAYWVVEGLSLKQFGPIQASLARRFGGDPTVKDLPRVMRLPGFYHRKGVPFLSRLLREEGTQPFAAAEFLQAFNIQPMDMLSHASGEMQAAMPREILKGSRNNHLASLAGTMRHRGMSATAIETALLEENRVCCVPPLPDTEVQSIARSICRYSPGKPSPADTFDPASLEQVGLEAAVQTLAALDSLTYDKHRKPVAKTLGIRLTKLDVEVEKRRQQKSKPSSLQGTEIQFPRVPPWPEAVDVGQLLDELTALVQRFIVTEEHNAQAAALWMLATYYVESAECAPILAITSPEKRCGKSTFLAILSKLVARPLMAASITPATTFRVIDKYKPTLLIDEADAFLKQNEELRGILNSGHTRASAFVLRSVGDEHEPRCFSTFAFKAIACIGSLPATLADRSIEIRLRRRRTEEPIQKLREARPAEWEDLCRQSVRFAEDTMARFREARPAIPPELNDRAADSWAPLLALADLAGGQWPSRARQVALELNRESEDQAAGTRLLMNIRSAFEEKDAQELTTQSLLEVLSSLEEGGWDTYNRGKPLSARQFAGRLRPYGITSSKLRVPGATPGTRGYRRADFEDAWSRYLSPNANATAPQTSQDKGSGHFPSATPADPVADPKSLETQ